MRDAVRAALDTIVARFSDDAPEPLVLEPALRKRYGAFEGWPADGELGLFILGWSLGSGFSLRSAQGDFGRTVNCYCPDFARAARLIPMGSDPTMIALGADARRAFRNADVVVRGNLHDILYWPIELALHSPRLRAG